MPLTDHEIRVEIVRHRHDHLLESVDIVGITHAFGRPWNVDVPASDQKDLI